MPHGFPFDHTQREVTEMLEKADGPWLVPETTPQTLKEMNSGRSTSTK
jgi:hypothetical protein